MATPAPPPTEHVAPSSKDDNDGTVFIFTRGLYFTAHLTFGILALGGCLMVQCLLVIWFAFLTAQAHSMELQARMFEYVYETTIEKAQSERKKKKNVIRIEGVAPPQGTNAQKPRIIKKDFSSDENLSLNIRTSAPEVSPPVKDPLPLKADFPPPTPWEPLSASSPILHQQQPVELNSKAAEAIVQGSTLPTPMVRLPVSNPNWQTKSVRERKAGGGRSYAVKQVDVYTPGNDEPQDYFRAPMLEFDGRFRFLEPAASSSVTQGLFGSFLGDRFATTANTAPFQAPAHGRFESFFEPEIDNIKGAERLAELEGKKRFLGRKTTVAVPNVPFTPDLSGEWAIPSSVPAFLPAQKLAYTPKPVVKLPGSSQSPGEKANAPKRGLGFQSSTLENEQHSVNAAPKRVRRSMIKFVKPETPLQMPPKPQPSSDKILAKIEVEEPPKLAAPVEMPEIEDPPKLTAPVETTQVNWIEPLQPAVTVTELGISQDTSNISSADAEPDSLVDVKPANIEVEANKPLEASDFGRLYSIAMANARSTISRSVELVEIDQLRHRFLDTSVLKETPVRHRLLETPVLKKTLAEKLQLELMSAIQPASAEEAAREALVNAFHERESTRVELSHNYSDACVELFLQKAQEYKARRKALASLMPSGNLSFEDEASFPYLSTKDTQEPMVPSPTMIDSQRPYPLPSPPTSSEEDNEQYLLREDPAPLLAKASRAYQVLLKATKNMEEECSDCNSKFCLNSYSPAGQRKMKSAKDLYQKSRSRLRDAYESRQLPDSLAGQYPEVGGC